MAPPRPLVRGSAPWAMEAPGRALKISAAGADNRGVIRGRVGDVDGPGSVRKEAIALITLYVLACASVVLVLVLTAAGKLRPSERATKVLFAAFNWLIVGGVVLTSALMLL